MDDRIITSRREGIAHLTNNGEDSHLACFSRYGHRTDECAPVAWRVAFILARETGEPITADALDYAMGLVVNDREDVAYMIREYGRGWYGR